MSPLAFYRDLLANGVPEETAYAMAAKFEADRESEVAARYEDMMVKLAAGAGGGDDARRARNARYYQAKRLKASETSESKTVKTVSDASKTVSDVSDAEAEAPSRTRVVLASLPSLRSEEVKTPSYPSDSPPQKPKRSRLAPDGWAPSPRVLADLTADGFSPGEIERELANFRDHEFRDPKSDFDRTFRKWMRTARQLRPAPNERSHPDAKLAAKQANYARAWEGSVRAFGRDHEP